jgi:hypothetical protein
MIGRKNSKTTSLIIIAALLAPSMVHAETGSSVSSLLEQAEAKSQMRGIDRLLSKMEGEERRETIAAVSSKPSIPATEAKIEKPVQVSVPVPAPVADVRQEEHYALEPVDYAVPKWQMLDDKKVAPQQVATVNESITPQAAAEVALNIVSELAPKADVTPASSQAVEPSDLPRGKRRAPEPVYDYAVPKWEMLDDDRSEPHKVADSLKQNAISEARRIAKHNPALKSVLSQYGL